MGQHLNPFAHWITVNAHPIMNNQHSTIDTMLLPVVVGVAGHWDLRQEDRPLLAQRVREALREIRRRCPGSPLIMLSSIADDLLWLVLHLWYRILLLFFLIDPDHNHLH